MTRVEANENVLQRALETEPLMSDSPESEVNIQEFQFTDKDFDFVRQLLEEHTGITLSEVKKHMVYNRMAKCIRRLGLQRFDQYRQLIMDPEQREGEFVYFINALTTNLTAFFREEHHFDYLANRLLPQLAATGQRRLRIWSAGCSVGEEPYSLAMILRETLNVKDGWDIKILATDINTQVLSVASEGIYDLERVDNLSSVRLNTCFMRGQGQNLGKVRIKPELREMIHFLPLNLMADWPMKGPLDIIFCRNVMIYFNKETQRRLLERMANLLAPGGHLFIGHSESLYKLSDRFTSLGQTIYRRCD